jgi:hypothetical protein
MTDEQQRFLSAGTPVPLTFGAQGFSYEYPDVR